MESSTRSQWAAVAMAVMAAHDAQPRHEWGRPRGPEPKKATKDRSKIKAARKQNQSRK